MSERAVIIDYGAGNLTSVRLALEAVGMPCAVTHSPERVLSASRVVFPGVGAAGSAMRALSRLGLAGAIRTVIGKGVPFLGICLGTQVLLDRSEEDGGVDCLGVIPGAVLKFRPARRGVKIPQMGWNGVEFPRRHPVLKGIPGGSEFYFLHSYYPAPSSRSFVVGRTNYAGAAFASVLSRGSCIATQFHPERSGKLGLRLLENFCKWDGTVAAGRRPC